MRERTAHPISDGSKRDGSPFVDLLVKTAKELEQEDERREYLNLRFSRPSFLSGGGFLKTTTADLIREEELRRDAKRNGKLKTGRE